MEAGQEEKAIIIGSEEHGELEELAGLVRSATAGSWARSIGVRAKPDAAFVGEGKLWELKGSAPAKEANLAVFDDELTPVQTRNLQKNCRRW